VRSLTVKTGPLLVTDAADLDELRAAARKILAKL
jgi:hypothetical protein